MSTYYAVCDSNGPISKRIEAVSNMYAMAACDGADMRSWIDNQSTDAEDDLDIDGDGMTEDEFAEAMQSHGCTAIADLDTMCSHPQNPIQHVSHIAGGWRLWKTA